MWAEQSVPYNNMNSFFLKIVKIKQVLMKLGQF